MQRRETGTKKRGHTIQELVLLCALSHTKNFLCESSTTTTSNEKSLLQSQCLSTFFELFQHTIFTFYIRAISILCIVFFYYRHSSSSYWEIGCCVRLVWLLFFFGRILVSRALIFFYFLFLLPFHCFFLIFPFFGRC